MKIFKYLTAVLIAASFIASGCSKDEEQNYNNPGNNKIYCGENMTIDIRTNINLDSAKIILTNRNA